MSTAILADAERMEAEARKLYATLYEPPPADVTNVNRWWNDTYDRVEELREDAASIRTQIASSRNHIAQYYGLAPTVGLAVKHDGRPGRIVGFAGQYVAVQLDGDEQPSVCHATSRMEYPPGTQTGPGPDERFAHLVQVKS